MVRVLAIVAAVSLFAALAHAVLVIAGVSEPAGATVYGVTPRRLWATAVAALALVGAIAGSLTLVRSRRATTARHFAAIVALAAGLIGAINGGVVVAVADGGPGSGNGVVGGAGAVVLGLFGAALGGLALARLRRTA
jgi:hypothetical protein